MEILQDSIVKMKNRKIVLYWQFTSFLKEFIRSIVCGIYWNIELKEKKDIKVMIILRNEKERTLK